MKKLHLILLFMLAALTFGCGSDSGSSSPTVKITVATSGTLPPGTSLAGVGLTLSLPAGATPALDATGQINASQLVTPSGVTVEGGLVAAAVHLEATNEQQARLSLVVASKDKAGFGVGESMVLTLNRMAGTAPQASDFSINEVSAADLYGQSVSGLQAIITAVKLE